MSKSKPFFSVVIPTHNRPTLLARAVESLLVQSFTDYELVIINDGSSISYQAFFDQYASKINYYLLCNPSRGVSAARNAGITLAKGEWVIFLDDDDEFSGTYLTDIYNRITYSTDHPEFLWSGVEKKFYDANGSYVGNQIIHSSPTTHSELLVAASSIGLSYGVAIKRTTLIQIGNFDENFPVGEDTELIIRLLANNFRVGIVDCIGIYKHDHLDGRLTQNFIAYSQNEIYERIFERYTDFFYNNKDVYLSILNWSAYVHQQGQNTQLLNIVLKKIEGVKLTL